MARIEYVLLNNPEYLELPSIIETSNRAATRLEDLDFVQNSIVCPRHEMHHVLKILKIPSIINDDIERRSLTNKLIEIALSNNDRGFKKEYYYVVAIKFLIEIKLKTKINSMKEKWTRSDSNKFNMMINLLNENVKKRKNNSCNKFNFKYEHKRSMNELVHLRSMHY